MELALKHTPVFTKNLEARLSDGAVPRIIVNQGGTRSSKTYSLCQLLIYKALTEQSRVIQVMRKTLPALRDSVLVDFHEVLSELELWPRIEVNKTTLSYFFRDTGSLIQFQGLDNPQKKRGAKRHYLYLNEANEFTLEDWRQLILRTTGQVYLDFNPSDEFHWIYDHILDNPGRTDCVLLKSTYLDNPFLSAEIIKEIELLKNSDPMYWTVYGLGERGKSVASIYTHWKHADAIPEGSDICYGLDFGYNNPSALVKIGIKDRATYWEEVFYKSHLNNPDIIELLKAEIPPEKRRKVEIWADAAEPKAIEDIKRAGFNIHGADKSVDDGIKKVKSMPLYIVKNSINLLREVKGYKYKVDRDGRVLEDPVKFNDHAVDAGRYGTYNYYLAKEKGGKVRLSFSKR